MIVDRILNYIEYKKISKRHFYLETGLSNGFLDKVKDIGASKVEVILSTYKELSPVWLITGEGSMLKEVEPEKSFVSQERPPPDVATGQLIEKICQLSEDKTRLETENKELRSKVETLTRELDVRDPYKGKIRYKEAQPRESMAAEPKLKSKK